MRLSRVKLLFCTLLWFSHVSIRPAIPIQPSQLDNVKDGVSMIDSDGETHAAEFRRSVHALPQPADQKIDDVIILTASEREAQTTTVEPIARSRDDHIWPDGIVRYTFGQTLSFNYREVFTAAMNKWATSTCLQFLPAERSSQDHIEFIHSERLGCSSYVGRRGGGVQTVSMSEGCNSSSNALHLVGHAIGLWHEHMRPDRDNYIDVLYENINETDWDKFGKMSQKQFSLVPDVGYDIESVMHYSPFNFSKNGKETLILKDTAPLNYKHCSNLLSIGQREQLSYLDKLRVNKLYSCHEHVLALESIGRDCVQGSTTTTTSSLPSTATTETPPTDEATVKCPFSSFLWPVSPPPSIPFVPQRLRSGSVITLQLQHTTGGIRCAPKCRPKECVDPSSPDSLCYSINFQFQVTHIEGQDPPKVKSGDKVALRSRCNPSKWLDCSGGDSGNECSITKCSKCPGTVCYDVTSCKRHHFKIFGVGRPDGKLLNTSYQLYFRPADDDNVNSDSVLTCYDDDLCKLSRGGNFTNRGEMLDDSQSFKFTILT